MSSMGEAETATANEVMESDADAMSEPEINISSNEEDEVTASKSKGRPSSVVWNHFDRVTRKGQTKPDGAKCEAIGKALEACLIEWGVGRVCTVTMDNAAANDVAVSYLKKKLSKKSGALILGGEFLHMRCCAHIINLIVRDGLGEIKQSISGIHDVVKYVRSSPQREQRFKTCVVSEGITNKSFVCLDVSTRWNSTYLMLSTTLIFQKAFERLEEEDLHFLVELHMRPPTTQDWDNARNYSRFLEKFYETTLHLSGSSYATSNLYFNEVMGIDKFLSNYLKDVHGMYEGDVRVGSRAVNALAISVSIVAFEAAFSTGGCVVDQFRSSLSPKLIECLICMQDWLHATLLPFEVEENIEEMQELELGDI
ncbi:hypothetical protein RHSIM_Rhsim05G0109800 [Rhododendron simsii]|uniref:HAT C-terminal dimerisation domain-containing protein n=1 Tax=Rhododendron simsii TaxID=118357 RepID=A0A834LNQ5_RHOSS|nr:hypothetical protein RHSIM_Rhsim05G0109800 [Rhododendron simsii]